MRRYYTYDDDSEYLAHSKGPWKVHKYLKKIGEGANARYVYARDAVARRTAPLRRSAKYYAGEARAAGVNLKRNAGFAVRRARTNAILGQAKLRSAKYRARKAAGEAYGAARRKAKYIAGEARAAGVNLKRNAGFAVRRARTNAILGQAKLRSAKYRARKAAANAYGAARRKAKLWAGEARAAGINAGRAFNSWKNRRSKKRKSNVSWTFGQAQLINNAAKKKSRKSKAKR